MNTVATGIRYVKDAGKSSPLKRIQVCLTAIDNGPSQLLRRDLRCINSADVPDR